LPELATLVLSGTNIDGSGFAQLAGVTTLKRIDVSRTRFGRSGFAAAVSMKQLEAINAESAEVTDKSLSGFREMPNLRVLNLSSNQISEKAFRGMRGFPQLEDLNLANNWEIQDVAFNVIKTYSRLANLNVDRTKCSIDAVQYLKREFLPEAKINVYGRTY
jgi:Leucine-rich repeat (LRR) protein